MQYKEYSMKMFNKNKYNRPDRKANRSKHLKRKGICINYGKSEIVS